MNDSDANEGPSRYIVVTLMNKLLPRHRARFEDPLDDVLGDRGAVVGGGSLLSQAREIEYCNIEFKVAKYHDVASVAQLVKRELEQNGLAKGSYLMIEATHTRIEAGLFEGLGLYLNGCDLPPDVYEENDINDVVAEIDRLLIGLGEMYSHWEGSTETGLYYYGPSFAAMYSAVENFVAQHPLCQRSRLVQIA